jgi:hypothetical protein
MCRLKLCIIFFHFNYNLLVIGIEMLFRRVFQYVSILLLFVCVFTMGLGVISAGSVIASKLLS